jgi:hypothetical protein
VTTTSPALTPVGVSERLDAAATRQDLKVVASTSTLTDDADGCAASTTTSAFQRVTSIVEISTAETAVQQQNDPPRPAALYLLVHERGGDTAGCEAIYLRCRYGKVEITCRIPDAMAGEVQHQQVIRAAVSEEPLNLFADQVARLIDKSFDLVPADRGILQNLG